MNFVPCCSKFDIKHIKRIPYQDFLFKEKNIFSIKSNRLRMYPINQMIKFYKIKINGNPFSTVVVDIAFQNYNLFKGR